MLFVGVDSFTLRVPHPGSYEVRLHWTSYWELDSGAGCVSRAPDGFTEVRTRDAGTIRVSVEPSLGRLFSQRPRCER
jgi:hypothetical protein